MLTLYRILTHLAEPFLYVNWWWRALKGKEDKARRGERFGKASIKRSGQKTLWIHAASVGESHSIMPLLERLHGEYENYAILLTTTTQSAAKLMSKRLPERAFHQYIPYDIPRCVKKFLNHWKPEIAIFVESELWPNLLTESAKQTRAMMLINGRISGTSYDRWIKHRAAIGTLLSKFTIIHPGSKLDDTRFKNLGAKQSRYVGNLKYDAPTLSSDAQVTGEILAALGDRRVWLASSTHPGEEEMVARAHQIIQDTHPELLTIIVPRHPHRSERITEMLGDMRLNSARRSEKQPITDQTDMYIADTFGELGIFYRLTGITLIGGTLIPHGGHNPIEAAQLDCAILAGPHMENFQAITREFEEAHAIARVKDAESLAEKVMLLLRDQDAQGDLADNAHRLVQEKEGVVDNVMQELHGLMMGETVEAVLEEVAICNDLKEGKASAKEAS